MMVANKSGIILVLGGARSGKSSFAERLAAEINSAVEPRNPAAYIATGARSDPEFEMRIEEHIKHRAAGFKTFEELTDIDTLLEKIHSDYSVFVLECLTTWLGNIFYKNGENAAEKIAREKLLKITGLFTSPGKNEKTLIIVSNEVGLGIVPHTALGRSFRDTQGRINMKLAGEAGGVYFMISGIPMRIK